MTQDKKINPLNQPNYHPAEAPLDGGISATTSIASAGVAAGAALGMVGGLPGMAVGAVVGGAIGALAGIQTTALVNHAEEEAYWRDNHENRPYYDSASSYDNYAPAYGYGIASYTKYTGRTFDEIEPNLATEWDKARGKSSLNWEIAKLATRDAYDRLFSPKA
jgi:hypothetical protein